MAATLVTFTANKYYKSLATDEKAVYVYKPSTTSTSRGADFWISLNGATATDLVPMIVKWDDRASVQGYCNPQWSITINGPIDFVVDNRLDSSSSYYEFL